MPSNYFQFAARGPSEDSTGAPHDRPDIWNSPPDALASIASFLRAHGFKKGASYGTLAVLKVDEEEHHVSTESLE